MTQPSENHFDLKKGQTLFYRSLEQGLNWPPIRRLIWKYWYEYLAARFQFKEFTFMNYGFYDEAIKALSLEGKDDSDRNLIGLYHQLTRNVPIEGKRVLEVGSGRGGGASYIARHFHPESMVGVDRSQNAVHLCRRIHPVKNLRFLEGDAEGLPFRANSFDVVFNVESSHCYGSFPSFVKEVKRVLKPGGYFLYTDFRSNEGMKEVEQVLTESGLSIKHRSEITEEVLTALDRESDRKKELIQAHAPKLLHTILNDFGATIGSKTYNWFKDGDWCYQSFQLQK